MSEQIRVLGDLNLRGNLSFGQNYVEFPVNPAPHTLVVKGGIPYIYSELINSSGFFTWMPLTPGAVNASYLHTQGIASSSWTVEHNFNTNNFAYFVYDTSHQLVIAGMTIVNSNTCTINLTQAITGTVVLFSLQFMNSVALSVSEEFQLGTTSTIMMRESGGALTVNSVPVSLSTHTHDYSSLTGVPSLTSGVVTSALGYTPAHEHGVSSVDFAIKDLTVYGDIMPAVTGVSKIGNATHKFGSIYTKELHLDANTLYIDGVPLIGSSANTIQITADLNQGMRMATTGTGHLILDSQTATTIQTNGTNADVLIQSSGNGSQTRITSGTQVIFTAPIVAIAGDGTVSGNLTISGGLTVAGTTTTVNTTNLVVKDNIITLNKGENGSGVTARYSGLDIDRGDLSRQRIVWDETAGLWKVGVTNEEVAIATQPFVTAAITAATGGTALGGRLDIIQGSGDGSITAALATASTDATTKSTNAKNDAKTYADGLVSAEALLRTNAATEEHAARTGVEGTLSGRLDTIQGSGVGSIAATITANVTSASIVTALGYTPVAASDLSTGALAYADLSGVPTSLSEFINDADLQTSSDVAAAIDAIVGAAPGTLDTLAEIAAALAADESAAVALVNTVSGKADADLSNVGTLPAGVIAQLKGPAGDAGVAGTTGAAGPTGPTGPTGPAGAASSITGFTLNNSTVNANYTIPLGSNAVTVGPLTMTGNSVITVTAGSRWVVL